MRRQDSIDERNSRRGGFLDFGLLGAALRGRIIKMWRRLFADNRHTDVSAPRSAFDVSDQEYRDLRLEVEEIRKEIRELLMAEGRRK